MEEEEEDTIIGYKTYVKFAKKIWYKNYYKNKK